MLRVSTTDAPVHRGNQSLAQHVETRKCRVISAPFGTKPPLSKKLSVLLATGAASGSIATARNLGANGFDVGVVSSQRLAAAAWSRWVSRSYSAPPETKGDRFLERLIAIGTACPGQILLPTSDETVWLYTANADLLKQHFCVYQPALAIIQCILDKNLFARAAAAAGLAVLPSWDPHNIEDLQALAPTLPYPILVKPRTHVHRLRNDKGIVVHSSIQLIQQYQRFVDRERVGSSDDPLLQSANLPILQQFVGVGSEGVLSVTGFIDRTGECFVTRHATKVFQRSLPLGVGVCFESLPNDVALSDAVHHLCQHLGYFGIFEVEFVRFNGTWALSTSIRAYSIKLGWIFAAACRSAVSLSRRRWRESCAEGCRGAGTETRCESGNGLLRRIHASCYTPC